MKAKIKTTGRVYPVFSSRIALKDDKNRIFFHPLEDIELIDVLTPKDIEAIFQIALDLDNEMVCEAYLLTSDEYYKEIWKRFNEFKEK